MATPDIHMRIKNVEARIAKLESIQKKANALKSAAIRKRDQKKAHSLLGKLKDV